MLSREYHSIGISIRISVSGSVSAFAVIRASKCWTLASDCSDVEFEKRFACARERLPVIFGVGWINVDVQVG